MDKYFTWLYPDEPLSSWKKWRIFIIFLMCLMGFLYAIGILGTRIYKNGMDMHAALSLGLSFFASSYLLKQFIWQ